MCDAAQVQQVILALAMNALEATPADGRVSIEAAPRRRRRPELVIADTGWGIPKEHLDRIFEPFFTTKEAGKGVGLGLAVVYGIVTGHHGTIDVESEPGRGTTFTVRLPARQPEERRRRPRRGRGHPPSRETRHERDDRRPPGTLRILIVDDETIVRDSLGAWFRQDGHRVDVAEGGKEALHLVGANRYDMAFLDIKMPGMDGLELQTRLAAADPELSIVLMTAYASVDTAVKAMKNGAYDYIVKPFDPDDLSMLVKRAAEHRSLRAENVRLKKSLESQAAPPPAPRRPRPPCATCSSSSRPWPPRTRPCSSPASRAPARRSWRGPSTPPRRGATTRWWSSTAARCPRASSRASSSATRRAPSPGPAPATRGSSRRPRAGRSSSTRSAR